jgi:hypothetical protein
VTAADPKAKLVEIEREKRYLRLIFTIDPASKATTSSLPSGSGISYGGAFPNAGSVPEEPAGAIEKIESFLTWLVPLGTLGVLVLWVVWNSGSAPSSSRLVSTKLSAFIQSAASACTSPRAGYWPDFSASPPARVRAKCASQARLPKGGLGLTNSGGTKVLRLSIGYLIRVR